MRYSTNLFLAFIVICAETQAQGLYDGIPSPFFTTHSQTFKARNLSPRFLTADKQQHYKPKSMLLNTITGSMDQTEMYWMSSMTTQSYNHGKVGRFYLWDVQGNLRESKVFFDIAGKNRRGLKLVFSKFRF